MRRFLPTAAVLTVLAGCVAPKPSPIAAPRPVPIPVSLPPPAPLAADWRDWPLTPGDWSYSPSSVGSSARFGTVGATRFAIDCGNDRRVHVELFTPVAGTITVRTTSLTRSLTIGLVGDPPSGASADLGARDPLLDAMAFSRGRFTVEQAGQPALVIPAYAEIGRVIEDCRG